MSLPSIQTILKNYAIAADKKLGQNFLFDQNLTDKIVRQAGKLQGKTVIEIGPGPGLLTRSILAAGVKKLYAVEKDPRCIAALQDYLVPVSEGRLEIVAEDALHTDLYTRLAPPLTVIANLPYNISTELLFRWLDNIERYECLTLMFQREVAMRIMAKPHTKDYGRLSIKAQWLCEVEHGFDIPPSAFYPPPKVTSTVITLTPRPRPLAQADSEALDRLCKATFGQRRKTLKVSLKQLCKEPAEVLARAGIDPMRRPEELSVEEFCTLARVL